ncbi:glycine zipper 2TM domain-containing protein [Oleiagrimonas soli]|uniref:Uncharacterized protein YcfJ n=1 Tax=Oleiagrimonas soli TaxID=1543381 RepID=A0A099CTH8_9GAMM|nr:glycine zipper 2TM domain-containing protein [Oleiagrimonas soli]KGI76983.1 hypothetical protein LF63_0111960 [Oleiagrimonas soli]KGI77283.1 hypothetical protein LF63_0111950 [Oleiagrimonas soli]MBB6185510.1 uncharacterized protein YcfJ [Oleiagrimonas soli]
MKRLVTTLTLVATIATSTAALADPPWARHGYGGETYIDYARVMSVQPLYRSAYRPQQVCRDVPVGQEVYRDNGHQAAGTLLGAVIGGVLGNTIGKGDGRRAATVAGAVVGGAIGNRATAGSGREDVRTAYAERCRTRSVYAGDRVIGYDVTYRYRGDVYRTRMDHDPGRRLRVRVDDSVRPAE